MERPAEFLEKLLRDEIVNTVRIKNADKKDDKLLTTFVASPKIFGGTDHHKSFKSVATIMKKGTLTR